MFAKSLRYLIVLACLYASGAIFPHFRANATESTLGESVYQSVSEAVFLVESLDDQGKASAVGTAFLVADQRLVTNYHVVEGGKPYLRVGAIRVECILEKFDTKNDLAILRATASISAKPLTLSSVEPPAGSTVFAIGNPAGLERTISQGLVSGARALGGQPLLQVSASISPGSSGGPVVNPNGEVVGVAVGYLAEGQNLNFAVPVKAVRDLLQSSADSTSDLDSLLDSIARLTEEHNQIDFSSDEEKWKAKNDEIDRLLEQAQTLANGSPERSLSVADAAHKAHNQELAVAAARDALKGPLQDEIPAHRILSRALDIGSWFLDEEERVRRRTEALQHAQIVVDKSKKPNASDLYQLAHLLEIVSERKADAFSRYQQALAAARTENTTDLRRYYRGLLRTSRTLKEAEGWLNQIENNGGAEYFDWATLAERYFEEQKYELAGNSWSKVAALSPTSNNFCNAGLSYWFAGQPDNALSSYRKCIEMGTLEENSEERLANAYTIMSGILFDRGVYDQSITYAKQALALSTEEAWAYYHLSRSLNALERNGEAVAAAENAIRLSDGKFAEMHFALGNAHFDLRNWDRSARAFQKAAELDPQEPASAYNVALCMQNQRFYSDAANWYEEVLKRKPDHPDREEILKKIRMFRQ